MKIITADELHARLDFMAPLNPEPAEPQGVYCIPFEWNGAHKGTRISIAKAKEIAATLRASIADAEGRIVREAYDQEVERNKVYAESLSDVRKENDVLQSTLAILKQQLRKKRKK